MINKLLTYLLESSTVELHFKKDKFRNAKEPCKLHNMCIRDTIYIAIRTTNNFKPKWKLNYHF